MTSGNFEVFEISKMEPEEIRSVIKFFHLKGLSLQQMKTEFDFVLGDSSPSTTTISKWRNRFQLGHTSTNREPHPKREKMVASEENIEKVRQEVMKNRRVRCWELAEALRIPKTSIYRILTEDLGMKKLSARWVPRLLTPENKQSRIETSKECLKMSERDLDFFHRLITVDETWLHHYTPEMKRQSMQWLEKGEKAPTKAKSFPSAGKVMATVFWDVRGIIHIDYLEKGKTINGPYYANLLDKVKEVLQEKRAHFQNKKIFFLQDNAPPHKSKVAMEKIRELGFEIIPHPPYSPDLAPSDYFLFPKLKESIAGHKYKSNSEVMSAMETFFEELDKNEYCAATA